MTGALADATARAGAELATVLGAVVAVLLPALLMDVSHVPGSCAVGVLTLAVAALVHIGVRGTVFVTRISAAAGPRGDEAAPVLAGRVTDPVHHPLRPRAPGPS